jgi:hypothetical protein
MTESSGRPLSTRRRPVTVLAVAVLLTAGVATTPTGSIAASSTSEHPAASPVPRPTASVEPSPHASSSSQSGYPYSGPGDFALADPADGLAELDSYRATLTVTFDGTEAGGGRRWTSTTSLDHSRDPSTTALTVTHGGDLGPADPSLQAELGGVSYVVAAQLGCVAAPLDPASAIRPRLEPARVLSGLIGAEAAGHRSVNGVEADGYTFGEAALGVEGVADGSGEVWIASDGGYVVKYVLSLRAGPPVSGEATAGTTSWACELTRIGEPVTIDLPADCPTGSIDAPVLPDATDVANGPKILAFKTPSSLAKVVAFYGKAGKAAGWKLLGKPVIAGDTGLVEFRAGTDRITIIATQQRAITTVQVASTR